MRKAKGRAYATRSSGGTDMAWWTPGPKSEERQSADIASLYPKLSLRVPDELHVRLKVEAATRHTTVQGLVLSALAVYLAQGPRGGDA